MRWFVLVLSLCSAACSPPPLAHTFASPEALAREVLTALERRDRTRLEALALDEEEFHRRIWPALPAARPERNLPFSYVWGDLRQKSEARLQHTLGVHGGRVYQLEAVKLTGDVTDYGAYRVHRDAVLVIRDSAGQSHELRILGSMVEQDGAWKVFSYNVDD